MNIVSFNQIIELNHLLQKKELQCKVHIRDACGAQSFYIEQLVDNDRIGINNDINEDINKDIYNTIDEYFQSNKMIVVYRNDKHNFTIQ
ncbi:RDAC family protein [[Clostridium] fimetarium]|uniref:Uncharacterized protein n=1 Tax=[Clostridium] fimetarium TaxID=99656 RepID=A0A1I0RXD5_9FIRM|nr:hypothetical protein [[Clostridium] fimetarium]SEW46095.1 hypothetical protein SAMN05421659_12914 [[Clostridium] fimetarium]